jgi:heme/copper-type cytochrome/quinol oxidase subunit 3
MSAKGVDVSSFPTHGFDSHSTMWWGTVGFVLIEATGFVLVIAVYFYLWSINDPWPMGGGPPELGAATATLALLLVSLWPNLMASRRAKKQDKAGCRRLLVMMSVLGLLPLISRAYEFAALGVSWRDNAYGSVIWAILGLHTLHLLTDVADTLVLTALFFTRHAHGKRYSDVSDNAFYWNFIALSWVPLYLLVYWAPRL